MSKQTFELQPKLKSERNSVNSQCTEVLLPESLLLVLNELSGLVNTNVTAVFKTRAKNRCIDYYRHAYTANSEEICNNFVN